MNDSDYTVIVPARAGSTRLPNKNVPPLSFAGGITMLGWRLEQLKQVFPAEAIIVSSDSQDYLEIARAAGVRSHLRPDDLSSSTVPFADVVEALARLADTPHLGWAPPTSPLLGPRHMREMVERYEGLTAAEQDLSYAMAEEFGGYFAFANDWLNFTPGRAHRNSQDLARPVRITWGLSLRTTSQVVHSGALFEKVSPAFTVPHWAGVDVDDALDLRTAELLWPLYLEFETGVKTRADEVPA